MRRLVKAGVIPQQYARRFSLISAWAELVGYVGSITLCALRIAAALEREHALTEELHRRKKVGALIAVCVDQAGSDMVRLSKNVQTFLCCLRCSAIFHGPSAEVPLETCQNLCCQFNRFNWGVIYVNSVQEGEQAEYGDSELRAEVRALQERRLLRTLALTQDISDALLAISDIRGARSLSS